MHGVTMKFEVLSVIQAWRKPAFPEWEVH